MKISKTTKYKCLILGGGGGGKLPNAKWLRMTQNSQFCPICNFSNLFPLKWFRLTWNSQFCPICNFPNLFPPKWLRMTWNGQFCPIGINLGKNKSRSVSHDKVTMYRLSYVNSQYFQNYMQVSIYKCTN